MLTSGVHLSPPPAHEEVMNRETTMVLAIVVLLIVLSPGLLMCQTDGAMLHAHGNVQVNGTNVGDSTSILAGDRLDTGASSAVSINRAGSSVVVNPNSSVKYEKSSVEIISGSARVSTSKGMSAQVGPIAVTPQGGTAKFDVLRLDNGVLVESHDGFVTLNGGGHTITVGPGSNASLALGQSGKGPSQATTPPVFSSPAPVYELGIKADGAGGNVFYPVCTNQQECQVHKNVSTVRACYCRQYF